MGCAGWDVGCERVVSGAGDAAGAGAAQEGAGVRVDSGRGGRARPPAPGHGGRGRPLPLRRAPGRPRLRDGVLLLLPPHTEPALWPARSARRVAWGTPQPLCAAPRSPPACAVSRAEGTPDVQLLLWSVAQNWDAQHSYEGLGWLNRLGVARRYGCSKWAVEVLLRQLHDQHGIPVSIFRCGMILAHTRCERGPIGPSCPYDDHVHYRGSGSGVIPVP